MKKLPAILLMASICATSVGGATMSKNVNAEDIVKRENIDEFLLGSWVSYYDTNITSYEEQTEDLARSGMNWMIFPQPDKFTLNLQSQGKGFWQGVDKLYKENNMKFAMHADKSIEEAVEIAKELENCNSYYVIDEPPASKFPIAAEDYKAYYDLDKDRMPFVNMYPNYAGTANLGGSYEDYIRNWVSSVGSDTLEYLYFDHYPFTGTENVRASYFSDVETIRKVAYENNRMKTGGFTQMGWWNGMRGPNVDEARWSCNSLLAYGMKSISHFNWVSPNYVAPSDGGEGMQDFVLTSEGEKTDLYEPMQKLNWQIRQMGDLLMSVDCMGAYHTGEVPLGAEALPKSFIAKPTNADDELIISLFTNKDDSKKYISVFNRSTSENVSTTLNLDSSAGVEGVTHIKPDDFDVLPDHKQKLSAPSMVDVDITGNKFTVDLKPGEIKFYSLDGDVSIPQPITTPRASLKSGIHIGEQTVEITTPDKNAEIYYTLDGSYPTVYSNKYTKPLVIGKDGEISRTSLRFVSIRGEEISQLSEYDYFITDDSKNVAYKMPVTIDGGHIPFNCTSAKVGIINDGVNDPWKAISTNKGSYGWATIDFGKEQMIDKVYLSTWGNWEFRNVIVQLSTTPDFSSDVYTVYNNDYTNKMGQGVGVNENYVESGNYAGHTWQFEPQKARYIRCYNENAHSTEVMSIWTELMAFSSYDGGGNLLSQPNEWQMTGGGVWNIDGNTLTQTDSYDAIKWDRSYTLSNKTFKNFMLEAEFEVLDYDPNQNGYLGFAIHKETMSATQSVGDMGLYIGVEPKGRTFVYKGHNAGEVGPRNMEAIAFSYSDPFKIRVIAIDDIISIYVGGNQVYYYKSAEFDREAGYIAIQGGPFKLKVKNISLIDMSEFSIKDNEQNIVKVQKIDDIAVDKLTLGSQIIDNLPTQVDVLDSAGYSHKVDVLWSQNNYDRTVTGWTEFTGQLSGFDDNILNLDNMVAKVNVFVKAELDKVEFHKLIAKAESLDEHNFEAESWKGLVTRLDAALELDKDPFMVQNNIGVAHFQLFDAIEALISLVDKSNLQTTIDIAKAVDGDIYQQASFESFTKSIEKAEKVLSDNLSTTEDVNNAISNINSCKNNLQLKTPAVDKTMLTSSLEKAKTYETKKLSKAQLDKYNQSIELAEEILNNESASQENVDLAINLLQAYQSSPQGGCKGSMKGSFFISILMMACGCFIIKRKKI